MSREALEQYEGARKHQIEKSEARKIRTMVDAARSTKHAAGVRWPFELLQNALDAGPRPGNNSISIKLCNDAGQAIFEHDGAPFTMGELAALLSGGSSKEYESDETTGRFGTGFLATHVLAERTSLDGVVTVNGGFEHFNLTLDRSGDEATILENIEQCNDAIGGAEPIEVLGGVASARFTYAIDDEETFGLGAQAFRAALPYIYGTRHKLGEVRLLNREGIQESWRAETAVETEFENGFIAERLIQARIGAVDQTYRISRVTSRRDANAAVLILTEQTQPSSWRVVIPSDEEPRVYREYPLRGSIFISVNFIIDGHFAPDPERRTVQMTPASKEIFREAFESAVLAIRYAFDQKWQNYHLLARAVIPETSFNPDDQSELAWWREELRTFADRVSRLPIVETTNGVMPAVEPEMQDVADFIQPTLLDKFQRPETEASRLWSLVNEVDGLNPPISQLMIEWSDIAQGWATLELEPSLVTVKFVGEWTRFKYQNSTIDKVDGLPVKGDRYSWLARYIDIVGQCWQRREGVELSVLDGLIPDQRGGLHSPGELRLDVGVPEALKETGEVIGLDLRSGLVSSELGHAIGKLELEYATNALSTAVTRRADEAVACSEVLAHLRSGLPEGAGCSDDNLVLQKGTARFLSYLRMRSDNVSAIAQQVPFVTRGAKVANWGRERKLMAPVCSWDKAARPFFNAYPLDRILADLYEEADPALIAALNVWNIIHPDPLVRSLASELEGDRLAGMVVDDFPSEGVTVRGEEFSYIALLHPTIFNHVQDHRSNAQALLGLVLCYIVRKDRGWRERRLIAGTKDRVNVELPVHDALWLADLRYRTWVPVVQDEKLVRFPASVTTLTSLLDPSWLDKNDEAITFLAFAFGFDELDLRLLGIAGDAQEGVRRGLARILESGGADPGLYEALAGEIAALQRRKRDVERARRMGYAVQDAVREALEARGLSVEVIDRGFDFEVSGISSDYGVQDVSAGFNVGPYFVEVKATSTGAARLTPMQAETASNSPERYVLCVVDLRNVDDDRLDQDWHSAEIEELASMVSNIGRGVSETYVLVRRARESAVGIRNDAALRYEVPPDGWVSGVSIGEWVAAAFSEPRGR